MLDDLYGVAGASTQTELRNLLGCFLFSEDDVFKRIGVLSGGERNRYALAKLLLRPSNFLLLDEPTNHLDMRAKDVLLDALEKFTGTVVFVSHDRYFIDKLATRVFEIGEGEVRIFPGNYEDYLWRKEGGQIDLSLPTSAPTLADVPMPDHVKTAGNKRLNPMKLQKLQERAGELEGTIASIETEIAQLEASLSDFRSVEETVRTTEQLDRRRSDLAAALKDWEEVSETIESNS
jgi:ATP-binding cassette subfamily F protein 3